MEFEKHIRFWEYLKESDTKSMNLCVFRRVLENDAKQQIENVAPKSTKAGSKAGNDPRIVRSVRWVHFEMSKENGIQWYKYQTVSTGNKESLEFSLNVYLFDINFVLSCHAILLRHSKQISD